MSQPSHVFIVGLSRTGSTLTKNILNSSDYVGLGGESMYFGDQRWLGLGRKEGYRDKFTRVGDLKTEDGVERIVDYIYGIRQSNFWSKLAQKVKRDEFKRQILATDRSDCAFLDLAMGYHAGGKPIRGEKTPAHIYAVPTLLECYPNARIIQTFRDPRAVYISNKRKYEGRQLPKLSSLARRTKLMFEFYASLDVMLTWQRAIRLHYEFAQRYPGQYCLSKYEDLIQDPKAHLQELCNFIDIPFEESMLEQLVLNSSFLPKRQHSGFDTSAINRWRAHLHPVLNRWFVFWCRNRLLEFGYSL